MPLQKFGRSLTMSAQLAASFPGRSEETIAEEVKNIHAEWLNAVEIFTRRGGWVQFVNTTLDILNSLPDYGRAAYINKQAKGTLVGVYYFQNRDILNASRNTAENSAFLAGFERLDDPESIAHLEKLYLTSDFLHVFEMQARRMHAMATILDGCEDTYPEKTTTAMDQIHEAVRNRHNYYKEKLGVALP
jgi:hypothetical protein